MPKYTLDNFLEQMNEVGVKTPIKIIEVDAKGVAKEKELIEVFVQYDTKTTEIIFKIK